MTALRLSDFDFTLPEELIATRPARPRSSSRLLVATPDSLTDARSIRLPDFLRPGDRLVLNDTKVIPARLSGERRRTGPEGADTAARIEATLLEPRPDGTWLALLKPLKKVRDGETVTFSPDLSATVEGRIEGAAILSFNLTGDDFDAALLQAGAMPLPPYIEGRRKADAQDMEDYQTIWARASGAVAAPTASLHFDDALIAALDARGVTRTHVTLHVGAGTFLPVKVDDTDDHAMHAEFGRIEQATADRLNAVRAAGGRVIAVGTTSLRLLESATDENGIIQPFAGDTSIFITPGYRFRAVDGLMTNFHLPKSTLMMLVSALMGRERMMAAYEHAIAEGYRFYSYGDSSLLLP